MPAGSLSCIFLRFNKHSLRRHGLEEGRGVHDGNTGIGESNGEREKTTARTRGHTGLLYERTTKVCSRFHPLLRAGIIVLFVTRSTLQRPRGFIPRLLSRRWCIHRDRGPSQLLPSRNTLRVNFRNLTRYRAPGLYFARFSSTQLSTCNEATEEGRPRFLPRCTNPRGIP